MICLKFRTGSLIVFWFLDSGHGLHGDVSVRVEVVDHGVVVLIRVLVADLLAEFLCVADFWSFDDAGLLFYGSCSLFWIFWLIRRAVSSHSSEEALPP